MERKILTADIQSEYHVSFGVECQIGPEVLVQSHFSLTGNVGREYFAIVK